MGGSELRRLKTHWAKTIQDRHLAVLLIKVRPFIYTACRLHQATSAVIEQTEEPLAIVAVPRLTTSKMVVRLYDGVFWIHASLSNLCPLKDLKCHNRFRSRGQCFWLIRLLDYTVDSTEEGGDFTIIVNFLSLIKEFHLTEAVFTDVPNVVSALEEPEKSPEQPREVQSPVPYPPIPGVFAVSQVNGPDVTVSNSTTCEPEKFMETVHTDEAPRSTQLVADFSFPSTLSEWNEPILMTPDPNNSISNVAPSDKEQQTVTRSSPLNAIQCDSPDCTIEHPERIERSDTSVPDTPSSSSPVAIMPPMKLSTAQHSCESPSPTGISGRTSSILRFLTDRARKLVGWLGFPSEHKKDCRDCVVSTPTSLSVGTMGSSANQNVLVDSSTSGEKTATLDIVFRALWLRVWRGYQSASFVQKQINMNTRVPHNHNSDSARSLCAPLIDSFKHPFGGNLIHPDTAVLQSTTIVDLTLHSIPVGCCDTSVIQSAPGRLRDERIRSRSRSKGAALLHKMAREIASLSQIKLTSQKEENLRVLSG